MVSNGMTSVLRMLAARVLMMAALLYTSSAAQRIPEPFGSPFYLTDECESCVDGFRVEGDSQGNLVAVRLDTARDHPDQLFIRQFDSKGVALGSETMIAEAHDVEQFELDVASSGEFVVGVLVDRQASFYRFDRRGLAIEPPVVLPPQEEVYLFHALLNDFGRLAVIWNPWVGADSWSLRPRGRVYSTTGLLLGSSLSLTGEGFAISNSRSRFSRLQEFIAFRGDQLMMTYERKRSADRRVPDGVYIQDLGSNFGDPGAAILVEEDVPFDVRLPVPSILVARNEDPRIAVSKSGSFTVAWVQNSQHIVSLDTFEEDRRSFFVRQYDPTGEPISDALPIRDGFLEDDLGIGSVQMCYSGLGLVMTWSERRGSEQPVFFGVNALYFSEDGTFISPEIRIVDGYFPSTYLICDSSDSFLVARRTQQGVVAQRYQLPTQLTVTNLEDDGPGSLRWAVEQSLPGDTVVVAASGTLTLTSGPIEIQHSLTIQGSGPGKI